MTKSQMLNHLLYIQSIVSTLQVGKSIPCGDDTLTPDMGICLLIHMLTCWDMYEDIIYPLYQSWSKSNGRGCYPVPAPDGSHPVVYFNNCENKWVGEYGALRIELLEHCIKELSDETANIGEA